jgi:hypothetical protein
MDPNLFHLDWERVFEVLVAIMVLSFLLERALSIVFEHRAYIAKFNNKGLKAPIAFIVALLVCLRWDFDAVSMVVLGDHTTRLGEVITAAVIAGGSKASIKLFHDVMNVKSTAEARRERS